MNKLLRLLALASLGAFGLTSPAQAQYDNMNYRIIALQSCDVEGWGGYGSYDICVEATYTDLIYQGGYKVICYVCVPNFTTATEMPCFGARYAPDWCQVG